MCRISRRLVMLELDIALCSHTEQVGLLQPLPPFQIHLLSICTKFKQEFYCFNCNPNVAT